MLTVVLSAFSLLGPRSRPWWSSWGHGAERWLGASALAALACIVWWAVAAAVNGRRVARSLIVGPSIAPVAYGVIVGSFAAVAMGVRGEARGWSFALWASAAVCLHYVCLSAYARSAALLGDSHTRFRSLGRIPVYGAAVMVAFWFVGKRFMAPVSAYGEPVTMSPLGREVIGVGAMLAVATLAACVIALQRGMVGWERACARRLRHESDADADARDVWGNCFTVGRGTP
jgi:hypothetical protein